MGERNGIIFADDLARALEISEEDVYEAARTMKVPFAISTASPRRLFIVARDLEQWRQAVRGM
jgi:hypothetical protein